MFSNPRNGFVTRERLDRVFVNWEWRRLYQNATLTALPAIGSDHYPLVLRLEPREKFERHFKYKAYGKITKIVRRSSSKDGKRMKIKGVNRKNYKENSRVARRNWSNGAKELSLEQIRKLTNLRKKSQNCRIKRSKDIMELVERHFTDLFATTTRSKVEEYTRIIPKKIHGCIGTKDKFREIEHSVWTAGTDSDKGQYRRDYGHANLGKSWEIPWVTGTLGKIEKQSVGMARRKDRQQN
ncbi:hypothetical protein Ahy_A02g006475 [Arachis hypogaea]|uniref:Endonuclease/exonuclease/phosphatase domain-containing protein n=1 Tax=Arachis hypogaea TaxID=3818 RepID=A0A445EAE0_ARAHY|nr:hypothetical protein Ahy_A02g006475 [Arachis hypogaea]